MNLTPEYEVELHTGIERTSIRLYRLHASGPQLRWREWSASTDRPGSAFRTCILNSRYPLASRTWHSWPSSPVMDTQKQSFQAPQAAKKRSTKCIGYIVQYTSPLSIWSCSHEPRASPRKRRGMWSLLAHLSEGALAREHHRGAAGTEPGIIVGTISTDHAADGHEESIDGEKDVWLASHEQRKRERRRIIDADEQ